MIEKLLILLGIGFLTGTVTAISAGSGVTVVVPLLSIFLNYSMHEAIGTSLLVDVIASLNVAYNYYRHGRVDLRGRQNLDAEDLQPGRVQTVQTPPEVAECQEVRRDQTHAPPPVMRRTTSVSSAKPLLQYAARWSAGMKV